MEENCLCEIINDIGGNEFILYYVLDSNNNKIIIKIISKI